MSLAKSASATIVSLLVVALLSGLLLKTSFHEPDVAPDAVTPAKALWDGRAFETLLQGVLILGGVFAILMLLRSSRREAER